MKQKNALKVKVEGQQLQVGDLSLTFHRTLRIPDDGRNYPLPPSLGSFPLHRVDDFKDSVPASWREHGGVFFPMFQREAMWLSFHSHKYWRPQAVKLAVGMINAVSGKPWSQALDGVEQDYLVCPPQPWLDGINAGDGIIKQFVAMPLGMGYTVEGQVSGEEKFGGLQLLVFDPKDGKFSEPADNSRRRGGGFLYESELAGAAVLDYAEPYFGASLGTSMLRTNSVSSPLPKAAEMGLAAGGRMQQDVYPDPHGVETWDEERYGRVYVHIVNSEMYQQITGLTAPESPISAQTYAEQGYPWFDLYDEQLGDVAKSDILAGVKTVKEMDAEHGFEGQQDDSSIEVPDAVIIKYGIEAKDTVRDGDWGANSDSAGTSGRAGDPGVLIFDAGATSTGKERS